MGYIYCLYSIEDGEPRYIGKTDNKPSYRFKQHVAAALEQEPGPLYDWMRYVWSREQDVEFYILQYDIIPKDLDMFEKYWIGQFSGLLNVVGNCGTQQDSPIARQIKAALRSLLAQSAGSRAPP